MSSMVLAFTITTKDGCRHCPNEFDTELQRYLQSKGISLAGLYYKIEESKYTKWHAHGVCDNRWKVEKGDKFFAYFKPISFSRDGDPLMSGWLDYCEKQQGKAKEFYKNPLDNGIPYFIPEE